MSAQVREWLYGPLLIFLGITVAARYRWFNHTRAENYLNNFLALLLISNLLRNPHVEQALEKWGVLSAGSAQLLSLAVATVSAAEFMGFASVWSNPEKHTPTNPHTNWTFRGLAVVLGLAFMVVVDPERPTGKPLDSVGDWLSVGAWLFLIVNLIGLSYQVLRMAIAELSRTDLKPREQVVTFVGLAVGASLAVTSLDAVTMATRGELDLVNASTILTWTQGRSVFYETTAVTALAAAPLMLSAASAMAMDGISRHWRALQPLREDLAEVVPATTFLVVNPRRRKSTLDLHQTNVAIRDSMLQLLPHFREVDPARVIEMRRFTIQKHSLRYAELALRLADARAARAAGDPPTGAEGANAIGLRRTTDLEAESTEMLRLARWWSSAVKSAAAHRSVTTAGRAARLNEALRDTLTRLPIARGHQRGETATSSTPPGKL